MSTEQVTTDRMQGFRFIQGIIRDEQQIAEAERRFEKWWEAEGSGRFKEVDITINTLSGAFKLKSVIKEAWMNGAFIARENN